MGTEKPGEFRARTEGFLTVVPLLCALMSLGLLVAVVGWEHEPDRLLGLEWAARVTLALFGVSQASRWGFAHGGRLRWARRHWASLLLGVLALAEAVAFNSLLGYLGRIFPAVNAGVLVLAVVVASQVPVLLALGLRFARLQEFFAERAIGPGAVLMITFGALIVAGALLFKVPRATTHGISWLDSFFTSTSAVCVTGLIVVDTETAFTPTGHVMLLVLLQLGGLGVMTLTTFLAQLFGGVSLRGRVLVQDLISEDNIGRIGRTLKAIFGLTIAFELLGAVALYQALEPLAETRGDRIFAAIFHSVSAFCNAGFSIWSGGLYDSIVRSNTILQIVIMVLIVAGGLGFPTWFSTAYWFRQKCLRWVGQTRRRTKLSLHARLSWISTLVLIVGGAVVIGVAEFGLGDHPHDTPVVVASLFDSITARTAGFNISPIETLTPAAVSMLVLLMFIGGSPGGTAGGAKTTTFVVALLNVRRILLARRDVEAFGRRIPEEVVTRAMAVLFLSLAWAGVASTLLALFEPGIPLSDLVFETVSALATVGLTRDVTPLLSAPSKVVIIVTMFAGRVGVLYFIFAFLGRRKEAPLRYPEENVYVT